MQPLPPDDVQILEIVVTTEFEAVHCWPNAPEGNILKHPHRHKFFVRVKFAVTHTDRQLEFLDMKEVVEGHIANRLNQIEAIGRGGEALHWSCEDFCNDIAAHLQSQDYPVTFVSVFEDNENGAELTLGLKSV